MSQTIDARLALPKRSSPEAGRGVTRTISTTLVSLALAAVMAAGATPARGQTQAPPPSAGEYALVVEGNTVMSLRLHQGPDGQLAGSVSVAGKTLAVTGAAHGGKLQFVTPSADGSLLHWEAVPQGRELAVTLVPPGLDGRPDYASAQQHVLTWRDQQSGGGGGASAQVSQWVARLAAVADSVVSWCAAPQLRESAGCQTALRVIHRAAPALLVARFASSGKAMALVNTLRGSTGGATAPASPVMEALAVPDPRVATVQPVASTGSPFVVPADGTTPNADPSGEYAAVVSGQPLVARLAVDANGALGGTITYGEASLPITGSASGERVEFTTAAPNGEQVRWDGTLHGDQLSLTLQSSRGTERHVLTRRRPQR